MYRGAKTAVENLLFAIRRHFQAREVRSSYRWGRGACRAALFRSRHVSAWRHKSGRLRPGPTAEPNGTQGLRAAGCGLVIGWCQPCSRGAVGRQRPARPLRDREGKRSPDRHSTGWIFWNTRGGWRPRTRRSAGRRPRSGSVTRSPVRWKLTGTMRRRRARSGSAGGSGVLPRRAMTRLPGIRARRARRAERARVPRAHPYRRPPAARKADAEGRRGSRHGGDLRLQTTCFRRRFLRDVRTISLRPLFGSTTST